jgi:DNA-binding HxlR family transcriptional regulator
MSFMKKYFVADRIYDCAFHATVSILASKWKLCIILSLLESKTLRYGELKRKTLNITDKMFIQSLRELEADGIVHRKEYPGVPPKVEYSLTEIGKDMQKLLKVMDEFGERFGRDVD